jgi:hypothetical protein
VVCDPSKLKIEKPETGGYVRDAARFASDMLIPPLSPEKAALVEVERGPNIKPCPVPQRPLDAYTLPVPLKAGDNIPTDEGGASPRTEEPRPYGRRRRVPTDEGGASLRTKEARPYGRRSRVPTDEGGASLRTKEPRP